MAPESTASSRFKRRTISLVGFPDSCNQRVMLEESRIYVQVNNFRFARHPRSDSDRSRQADFPLLSFGRIRSATKASYLEIDPTRNAIMRGELSPPRPQTACEMN